MRYPGGKSKFFQHIVNLLPRHHTYIETHLGGGAVMCKKRPAERSIGIDIDPRVIAAWKQQGSINCELHCIDAVEFLTTFPFRGGEAMYVDPPYLPETRRQSRVYRCDYTEADHVDLLKNLKKIDCPIIISGYESTLYNDLLSGWRTRTFDVNSRVGKRQEVLWLNYKPVELHEYSYLGDNFREREAIRRRQTTLRNRIEQLSPIERLALVAWLDRTYAGSYTSLGEGNESPLY